MEEIVQAIHDLKIAFKKNNLSVPTKIFVTPETLDFFKKNFSHKFGNIYYNGEGLELAIEILGIGISEPPPTDNSEKENEK